MTKTHRHTGFTLLELLIVTVILGILASLVIGSVSDGAEDATHMSFIQSGRTLQQAARRYHLETGEHLEAADSGVLPAGFENYVQENRWNSTPLGGVWDTELGTGGVSVSLGVHFNGTGATRDDAYMTEVDAIFDDGDLTTGDFRKIGADRFAFVVAN